jgi:hypothetical protein
MPFGFLKRRAEAAATQPGPAVAAADARGPRPGIPFEALTEDWRLVGTLTVAGRLLDMLNHREALSVSDVAWRPADGSEGWAPAPGIRTMDPYDLIVVAVTPDSLPPLTDEERTAHKIHKVGFNVALEVPPYRVLGTIHLHPGADPDRLLDRSSQMFFAVTSPTVSVGGRALDLTEDVDAVLVNRFYLRGVEQVDLATGRAAPRLPGQPLGGTTWTDKA